ncbi:MAG: VOC family protein [Kineosporiaceae bacterium]
MTTLTPFLMFEGRATEAVDFYLATIPGSSLGDVQRYGADGPGPEGTIIVGEAVLGGLRVKFSDSFVSHGFTFTPSLSLFLDVDDPADVDALAEALGAGGGELMPPGDYGFSRRFAWVNDRFGVSWQLNAA